MTQDRPSARRKHSRARAGAVALSVLVSWSGGCTRHFFRERADREVAEVLKEKDCYPEWAIDQYHIYPDPRSRFADPTPPDRPPMPPDDPAAHDQAPNPQKPGKCGVTRVEGSAYLELLAAWDAENRQQLAEREKSEQSAKPTTGGLGAAGLGAAAAAQEAVTEASALEEFRTGPKPYRITLEQASELGLINAREFQDRREDLFLAALPVTLQRFSFAAQAFATEQAVRNYTGSDAPGGQSNSWSNSANLGFAKLFSTGALLLFKFANQTVIDFARSPQTVSQSTVTLDIVQPFLRGAGRAVTLEPLTLAERNLVYAMRSYARFRKEFFVSIAGGGGGSISGGVFVPSGVIANGVSGNRSANFGTRVVPGVPASTQVANPNGLTLTPGTAGTLNITDVIPAPVSGYLGTQLQYAQIELDRYNISNLQNFLRLFEGFKEGGDVSQLQVDQVEQQLLSGRSTLYSDQQQYIQAIDNFKLQLGLPTDTRLELDDTTLLPLIRQFRRYEAIFRDYDEAGRQALAVGSLEDATQARAQLRRLAAGSAIVRDTRFKDEFPAVWNTWAQRGTEELAKETSRLAQERLKLLDTQVDRQQSGKELTAAENARLDRITFELDVASLERTLRAYETQPWNVFPDPKRRQAQRVSSFRFSYNSFMLVLGVARNERLAQLKTRWPDLPKVCAEGVDLIAVDVDRAEEAVARTALLNRLDLMNVRAQAVDAWRQIAVFANDLLGAFNLEYRLTANTPTGGDQPLSFATNRVQHQLVINAEPPLVRKSERNAYRASLIGYQRQRRQLQEAEDLVKQSVRGEIRQLRVLAENYKIQQRQVELAYRTVESSLDTFQAPPGATPANAQLQTQLAANAASLTTQLLNAQRNLPAAQNSMLTVWINYLNTRLQLYRDMELMPLDARGVWIDDPTTTQCTSCGAGADAGRGPGVAPAAAPARAADRGGDVPGPDGRRDRLDGPRGVGGAGETLGP